MNTAQWIDKGNRLLELGELDQAGEAYAQVVWQEPDKPFHHFKLGTALLRQKQTDAAERCFQQALTLNENSHLGLYGMAQVAAARAEWQTAVERYEHLLSLSPGFAAGARSELEIVNRELAQELERAQELQRAKAAARLQQWPYVSPLFGQTPATLPHGKAWPKISVVTPTYNQGDYIEETILSVINQNYPNIEYIVIDGGSTDETINILRKYQAHFSYCVSEPDDGQSSAINKGFAQATGEIFTWLNSDDRFSPGALHAAAVAFYTSQADMVAGACELLKDDEIWGRHLTACPSGPLRLEEILDAEGCWLTGRFFYQPEVMFSKDLWERAGGYVDTSLYYSMDYELWARFAHAKATISVIGAPIAQYRMHEAQKTSTTEAYQPELLATAQRLREKFSCTLLPAQRSQRPLRIAFFSDVGDRGGAGIAHHRIAQAFQAGGHHVESIAATLDWSLTPSSCTPEEVFAAISQVNPDLVVVGNVHNTQRSIEILEAISDRFLTLFVMHDQWLMTGRCAYNGGCPKYLLACDEACPTANVYPIVAPDNIFDAFKQKRALLEQPNFFVAADSPWLTEWSRRARKTLQLQPLTAAVSAFHTEPAVNSRAYSGSKFSDIHYGLDTDIFQPIDQSSARSYLDLPQDKFIIISGSQSLKDERKGATLLFEALQIINRDDVLLVCFGHGAAAGDGAQNIHFTGFVEDPAILAWYYAAADVFVGPSKEEAFGQTFIEAAACGTPAVGFRVGGVTSAIAHNISGKLAQEVSAPALAATLRQLIEDPAELARLKQTAPIHIRNMFSMQRSYYSLVRCLEDSGILNRLNLRLTAKVNLEKTMPQPQPIQTGLSADLNRPFIQSQNMEAGRVEGSLVSGFGHAELPRRDLMLPGGSRWLFWPSGRFLLRATGWQTGQLTIVFRNLIEGQMVTLKKDTDTVLNVLAVNHSLEETSAISLPVLLQEGLNFFSIQVPSFHEPKNNEQKLGLLVERIVFSKLPSGASSLSI